MNASVEIIPAAEIDARLRREFRPIERLCVRRDRRRMARICAGISARPRTPAEWADAFAAAGRAACYADFIARLQREIFAGRMRRP